MPALRRTRESHARSPWLVRRTCSNSQRQLLLIEIARSLKATKQLVVTSDYYFESAWQTPGFLEAGVTRADDN